MESNITVHVSVSFSIPLLVLLPWFVLRHPRVSSVIRGYDPLDAPSDITKARLPGASVRSEVIKASTTGTYDPSFSIDTRAPFHVILNVTVPPRTQSSGEQIKPIYYYLNNSKTVIS